MVAGRSARASDSLPSWQAPAPGRLWRWAMRLSLATALAASAYLAWASLAGGTLVGCSGLPQIGCEQALSGRWAWWCLIPVSVPGFFAYTTMLLAAACLGPKRRPAVQRAAWLALVPLAMLATGAAVWFISLMVFAEEKFCPWCLVVHANGLFCSGLVLVAFLRKEQRAGGAHAQRVGEQGAKWQGYDPAPNRPLPLARLGGLAAAALSVLILGQWLGPRPQTHRVELLSGEASAELGLGGPTGSAGGESPGTAKPRAAESAPSFPVVADNVPMRPGVSELSNPDRSALPGSGSPWDPRANPYFGDAGARYVVVEMLDYSCRHCRQVYQHLKQAHQRYGSQFVVVVLPVPMNKDCNEYVSFTQPDHVDACHYARLAVAVWLADPKKYPLYHDWLLEPPRPPSVADATAHAAELVGREALESALHSPQVEQVLARNRRLYHLLGEGVLPKLVIGRYMSSGQIQYPETVFGMLEDYLGIRPAAAGKGGPQDGSQIRARKL